jgi:hypothetical protein
MLFFEAGVIFDTGTVTYLASGDGVNTGPYTD